MTKRKGSWITLRSLTGVWRVTLRLPIPKAYRSKYWRLEQ